ncbi:MAG TPA: PqqD family protein [Candidatus Saccharimonadales bacterium]|nr:PqqD family protein [Candidatus Saccharimonadales bacterium]
MVERNVDSLVPSPYTRTAYSDDGQAVVLQVWANTWTHLEPTAAKLWRLLNDGKTVSEALAELAARFGLSAGQLEADFATPIQELVKEKLLVKERS